MKKKTIITIVIIAAVLVVTLVALCIPIPRALKDGGTIEYNAVLYSVRKVHSLHVNGYEEGTKIRLLLWTIYDDVRLVEYEADDEAEGELGKSNENTTTEAINE